MENLKTYLLQNEEGQISKVHSISAGLDYPGVGPEHSALKDLDRVEYVSVTDEEALKATKKLCELEGILPALETAHAFAHLEVLMPTTAKDEIVVVNTSGRGDKDINTIMTYPKPSLQNSIWMMNTKNIFFHIWTFTIKT